MSQEENNKKIIYDRIIKLITQDELEPAFKLLEDQKEVLGLDSSDAGLLALLQARYNVYLKKVFAGTSDSEELNKIRTNFILFVKRVQNEKEVDEIEKILKQSSKDFKKINFTINAKFFFEVIILFLVAAIGFYFAKDKVQIKFISKRFSTTLYLRDGEAQNYKGIELSTRVFTIDNLVFDKSTCPAFEELRNTYDGVNSKNWNFLDNPELSTIDNPSLERFREAFEKNKEEVDKVLATKVRLGVFCDAKYWQLQTQAETNDSDAGIYIFPEKEQEAAILLNIYGISLQKGRLSSNYAGRGISQLIQQQSANNNFEISPIGDHMKALMLKGETIEFEAQEGWYRLTIDRIANPGSWREPYSEQEDIVTIKVVYAKKRTDLNENLSD